MKYKNYKSAIHNFAHSFQSIDWMKSGKQSFNVLVELENHGLEPRATFDFINGTIEPENAKTENSQQLLNDYMDWLPEHCLNHNCDPEKLTKLRVTIWTNFKDSISNEQTKNRITLNIRTETIWQVIDRPEQRTEISQLEGLDKRTALSGVVEF